MPFYELGKQKNNAPIPVEYLWLKPDVKGRNPRMHYHEYAELLFGVSGVARVTVGNTCYDLAPNTMALVYPGEPHDVIAVSAPCTYHVVKFLPNVLLAEENSYSEYAYPFLLMDSIRQKQIFFTEGELEHDELLQIFNRIKEEWLNQSFGYELSLRADVTRLCLYVMRLWQEKDPNLTEEFVLSGRGELMQKAVAYIREHYADLTEEATAEAAEAEARPDVILSALQKGDFGTACDNFYNIFEDVVPTVQPYVDRLKAVMRRHGAIHAMMSGSGPSVFGIFASVEAAAAAVEEMRSMGASAFVCHPTAKY